jgi:hypothetical protein
MHWLLLADQGEQFSITKISKGLNLQKYELQESPNVTKSVRIQYVVIPDVGFDFEHKIYIITRPHLGLLSVLCPISVSRQTTVHTYL